MNPEEATYVNLGILVVLAILISALMTMMLWLICLVREVRKEVSRVKDRWLSTADDRGEIRALQVKGSSRSPMHTDDLGS